jgi:hypothetical protein
MTAMKTTQGQPTRINPLQLRAVMGRDAWHAPIPFGPAGWRMNARGERIEVPSLGSNALVTIEGQSPGQVIVTQSPVPNGQDLTEWIHASLAWHDRTPSYDELMLLKRAVWGDVGEAYQVHPGKGRHVNIHSHALHLWGRADGRRVLPDFGQFGTI